MGAGFSKGERTVVRHMILKQSASDPVIWSHFHETLALCNPTNLADSDSEIQPTIERADTHISSKIISGTELYINVVFILN